MESTKVIFLDIDGVMNSHVFYEKRWKQQRIKRFFNRIIGNCREFFGMKRYTYNPPTKLMMSTFQYKFNRLKEDTCMEKWKWLADFCNENGYKICISSTWKNLFNYDDFELNCLGWEKAFTKLGFNPNTFVGCTRGRRTLRGQEIAEWLDNYKKEKSSDIEYVNIEYAILDDDSDMLPEQMKYFHHSDPWFGMNPNILYRIKLQFDKGITNTYKFYSYF